MKENAKLVLPKIAPFNEGEDDPLPTLKEDDEPKTRSSRKRKAKVKSLSENLPRISSSGTLNLTCLGLGERDAFTVPSATKEGQTMQRSAADGLAANAARSPSTVYKGITVTGQKTLFNRVEVLLPDSDAASAQMLKWPAVPWIFPRRRKAGAEDLACLLLITRAHIRTKLPRVAIEGWVPGTVAVPTFHCQKCLAHWKAYGALPRECNEPGQNVEGPPMYLTGKGNIGRRMPVQNAYNSKGNKVQICIDVTAGRQSRAEGSKTDLQPLETTKVDADELWDLNANELDHSGSDDGAFSDDVQFLSRSQCHMSTDGQGSKASTTSTAQLPPIITASNVSGAAQVIRTTSETGSHLVPTDSCQMQEGRDCLPFVHRQFENTDPNGASVVGLSGTGSAKYSERGSGADDKGFHSISTAAQDSRAGQHGGRTGKDKQNEIMGTNKDGMHGNGEVGHSSHHRASYSGKRTEGRAVKRYGTSQDQGPSLRHSHLESEHSTKRSRNVRSGENDDSSLSPGSDPAPLQTAGRIRSPALAGRIGSPALAGDDPMCSTRTGNTCSSTTNQQVLHTSSSVHYLQSSHDGKVPITGKHEASIDGNEQSGRPEHQNLQSPTSSRSVVPAAEPMQTNEGDPGHETYVKGDTGYGSYEEGPGYGSYEGGPGYGSYEGGPGYGSYEGGPGYGRYEGDTGYGSFKGGPGYGSDEGGPGYGRASGQGLPSLSQPKTREKKLVRQATIKENVEYVADKVKAGKKKKAQLRKSAQPTANSQSTSYQGSAVNRRDSYAIAQTSSQSEMHQIDTSKLEEQRQSGTAAAHGSTANPPHMLHNTTKSRDVSFPTRRNSKNLDEVVHQSPNLYQGKSRQHTDIRPSSQTATEGGSHGQRTSSGWREQGDLQTDQQSNDVSKKDQEMSGTAETDGGVPITASNQDRKLLFSHGTGSDTGGADRFLQQQSQTSDATTRRPSSSTEQTSTLQDQCPPKGSATGDTLKTSTASTLAVGTANGSDDTNGVQMESKLSKPLRSEESLGAISEASEADEALAELEYYSRVHRPGFDIMSVVNFTRSFTYSMFPMSKQHKELRNAIHASANATGKR